MEEKGVEASPNLQPIKNNCYAGLFDKDADYLGKS